MKELSINESIALLKKLWKVDALTICHINAPSNISGAPDENYKTSPEQNTRKRIKVFLVNSPNYLWTFKELKKTFDLIYRFTGWVFCDCRLSMDKDYPYRIVNLENYN